MLRPNNPMIVGHNPDLYRQMLTAAKETIAENGLRPWISCEAFNEWLEDSYLETQHAVGLQLPLEAIAVILLNCSHTNCSPFTIPWSVQGPRWVTQEGQAWRFA